MGMQQRPMFYRRGRQQLFLIDLAETADEVGYVVESRPFVRVYPQERIPCPSCGTVEWAFMKDTGEINCLCGVTWYAREQ